MLSAYKEMEKMNSICITIRRIKNLTFVIIFYSLAMYQIDTYKGLCIIN